MMKTKKTLKETVVEGIYREIEEGIYKPNDIIHEGEIMEKYAMSKSPVREALIELCKDNVLKSIPRVGYQVVPVTLKEILDLLEFRIDVETGNLRRLCQRITPIRYGMNIRRSLPGPMSAAASLIKSYVLLPSFSAFSL